MRGQVARLIEAAVAPGIAIQVLPFAAGPHQAMYGMFHVLGFAADEVPDVVYGENLTSAFYLDKPAEVTAYADALGRLGAAALPAGETVAALRQILREY